MVEKKHACASEYRVVLVPIVMLHVGIDIMKRQQERTLFLACKNNITKLKNCEHRRKPKLTQVSYLHDGSRAELFKYAIDTRLSDKGDLRVLDLGCGEKPYYPFFEEQTTEYVGVDIQKGTNVDIICDGEMLPLCDRAFDVVICGQVPEHLHEPRKALIGCYKVLNPLGVLFLFVPSLWPLHCAPHDFYRWTRYGIETELKRAVFDEIEVFSCGGSVSGILQMIMFAIDGFLAKKSLVKKLLSLSIYPTLNIIGSVARQENIESIVYYQSLCNRNA